MFKTVDLPQPLGPTIATKRPAATSNEMSCTAVYPEKRRPAPFRATAAGLDVRDTEAARVKA